MSEFAKFFHSFAGYAVALVTVLTAFSAILIVISRTRYIKFSGLEITLDDDSEKGDLAYRTARARVLRRMTEIESSRQEQQSSYKGFRTASITLTFAQYVIGGVLASSFVQESLNAKAVGVFGVLVLVASLLKIAP